MTFLVVDEVEGLEEKALFARSPHKALSQVVEAVAGTLRHPANLSVHQQGLEDTEEDKPEIIADNPEEAEEKDLLVYCGRQP